eukprot:TRINITY_DN1059_c0_g1_i1.p1 TRINITY_DN1059_c0_g1~~TRINITY_DN1059_c0_g1_i1.p1  ORF type:complete len:204 (+),score=43.51 TRINITY_DN1059_c0_g1_i1:52-663(+)
MAELHRQCGQEEMSIKSALAGQCSSSQPCTLQCTGLHQRAEVKAKAMKGNVKRLHRFADTHLEATTCRDVKSSLPVVSRRETMGISMLVVSTCIPLFLLDPSADARQRRNTQNIPIDQYKTSRRERKREFVDNPNGLFSAQAAPKPPKALYSVTEGMRVGGKRTVIVTPEFGYGKKGMNEIPADGTFELNIELLDVKSPTSQS